MLLSILLCLVLLMTLGLAALGLDTGDVQPGFRRILSRYPGMWTPWLKR